ncbi:histone H1.9-like [Dugong dugon]
MQKDTWPLPSTVPLASNPALGGGRLPSMSGIPNKSETGHRAFPKPHRRPSMSRVILEAVADKGARHCVSLPTLKKAVTTMGYNMARNTWRFKRVLKGLADKGMLKQVTGKGLSGSFRIGKKQASKSKPKLKRRQPL